MSLLVISGISGSGKSTAIKALEDIGYFCIDNLPPALLLPVARLQSSSYMSQNTAIVIDCRAKEMYRTLNHELTTLKENHIEYRLVFFDAEQERIIGRYKQTRRKHPLISEKTPSLEEAIKQEYKLCKSIKEAADIVLDTTYLSATKLKTTVIDMFKDSDYDTLTIKIESFGYKNGIPSEADLVFDVRCMPNPYYIEKLRDYSGLDECVFEYVFSFEQSKVFAAKMTDLIRFAIPHYVSEGKTELVIAIGCTSGHHRSVAFTRYLADALSDLSYQIVVMHRDIDKNF